MCSIDLDPASLWDEREVKARKRHTCDCCHGLIKAGVTYVKHFSICDGDVSTKRPKQSLLRLRRAGARAMVIIRYSVLAFTALAWIMICVIDALAINAMIGAH